MCLVFVARISFRDLWCEWEENKKNETISQAVCMSQTRLSHYSSKMTYKSVGWGKSSNHQRYSWITKTSFPYFKALIGQFTSDVIQGFLANTWWQFNCIQWRAFHKRKYSPNCPSVTFDVYSTWRDNCKSAPPSTCSSQLRVHTIFGRHGTQLVQWVVTDA